MIFVLLLLSVIGFILIAWFGWKAKTHADLILYQTMPCTFIMVLFVISILSHSFLPIDMQFNAFVVVYVLLSFFAIVTTTALGIKGLIAWRQTNDNFLLAVSFLSVITIITNIFMCFLYPILFGYMLFRKWTNRK